MKKKGIRQKRFCQLVSLLLAAVLVVESAPFYAVKAEEDIPLVLQSEHSDLGELNEAYTYFSMGTVQSQVEEKGTYALTIYRDGNTDTEATVELVSADVSAKYGEDYIVEDAYSKTETTDLGITMLELLGDEENQAQTDNIIQEYQELIEGSLDTEENAELPQISEEMMLIDYAVSQDEDDDEDENKDVSALAEMKEEQTGIPTRETYEAEGLPLTETILGYTDVDLGQEIMTSSSTQLVFAPGETEKQVVFRILEDEESEGQELINFLLTAPGENSLLCDVYSVGIVINDDEPIVYSEVGFSEAEYEAESDQVVIKVVREKALYSLATVRIHSNELGDAETGVHFAGIDAIVELAPFQSEATVTIPVRAEGEMSFELVLSEFKGAIEGEHVTATVHMTESPQTPTVLKAENANRSGDTGTDISEITIDGVDYEVVFEDGSSIGKIMDTTKSPNVHVGDYYLPTPIKKTASDDSDVVAEEGNVEYGLKAGGSGRRKNEYNEEGQYGHLHWYSGWIARKGSEIARYRIMLPQYQSIRLDYETLSRYQSSECGMELTIENEDESGNVKTKKLKFARKSNIDRELSSAVLLCEPEVKEGETVVSESWIPNTWEEETSIDVYAKRTAKYLVAPEIKFYGLVAMLREFDIALENPDSMKYRNGDDVIDKIPANAVLASGNDKRYIGQDISILYSSTEEGGSINGELIGYDVKFGNDSEYYRYETTDKTLSLSGEFFDFIEEHTGETISVNKSKTSFTNKITLKPVFKYKDVHVDVIPCEYGAFDDANLKVDTTNVFHVGDTINLSASPYEKYQEYLFEAYESEAYANPGDTKPEEAGIIPASQKLTFKKVKYTLTPVFTQQKNTIEVQLDKEAEKLFTVTGIVPKEQLQYSDLKGKNIIYIEEPLDGEDHTRPVYGKVYEISLAPTAENDGTYRPVITQSYTGDQVNGFFMYVRAYEKASKNVIKVSAEKYDPEEYQYFSVDGYARYSSVTLRQGVSGLLNQPAGSVFAFTATTNQKLYDRNGNLTWMVQKQSGSNKEVRETIDGVESIKMLDGSYEINGIPAISGDTISIKVTNNDVEQVQYVTLSASGKEKAERSFSTLEANTEQKQNDTVVKTETCIVVETEPLDMPVRTPYSPYVSNVTYAYARNNVDVSVSSIPIIYAAIPDTLTVTAEVEFNGHDPEKTEVHFIVIDKNGKERINGQANYNESTGQYNWDMDPSANAYDGDEIYVQVVSEEITYTKLNTGLNFYTQQTEVVMPVYEPDIGMLAEGVPVFSNLSGMVSSGKIQFGMPEYEDPENKSVSPYSMTFAASISLDDIAKAKKRLNEAKNGKTEVKYNREDSIKNAADKVNDDFVSGELKKEDPKFDKLSEADQKKKIADNKKRILDREKKAAEEQFKKDSLAELNDNFEWDIKMNVLVRIEFMYSPTENQHIYAGSQYAVGFILDISKTQYWIVSGIPVYLAMEGWATLQMDGASTTDKAILTAAETLDYENLADLPVRPNQPWFHAGFGLKLEPGVGYCGLIGVRGIFETSILLRIYSGNSADVKEEGGVRFELGGGIGIDLAIFSLEYNVGKFEVNTGVFKETNYANNAASGTSEEMKATINPYEASEEISSLMGKGRMLRSSLEPIAKTDLIRGTLEYVRPEMATLPDGRIMMIYLQNGDRSNAADASQLVYSIRSTNGTWSSPTVVDPENTTAETSPAILCVGDKVYIAWSSANKPLSGSGELEQAKEDLHSLEIKMCVYDAASNTLGEVKQITDDEFMDSYVRMTVEDDKIAIYYLKEDLTEVQEVETLASFTANYNTWTKVLYDPAAGEFVPQSVAGGTVIEKLMNIKHPSINDPLVLDYSVAGMSYEGHDFSFAAYSVDTDKNIETYGDSELWLQMTIGDKEYYPIEVKTQSGYISDVQMTQLEDDVFLTWVSDTSVFNSISLKDLLEGLKSESADNFESILQADADEFYWNESLADGLEEETNMELYSFAEGNLSTIMKDFATPNTETRKEVDIRDYNLVEGEDGNIYLFWAGSTYDPDQQGTELFGTTFYRLSEEWQAEWDSNMPESGWGNPVQLTSYGEDTGENLVLDELDVVIQKNKGAVVIANTYAIGIDEETGEVQYGDHNLTEIVCKPSNSLEIVDDEISLSEDYPLPGESIKVSFNIKNTGLLPSEGNIVKLSVVKDGQVLATKESVETDPEDSIYVGNEFKYSTSLKIPAMLEYPFDLRVEVQELTKNGSGEYVAIGQSHIAERTVAYGTSIEVGDIADYNKAELEQFLANKQAGDPAYDAYQEAIQNMTDSKAYTHAYFVPVQNVGNMESEEISLDVVYVDEYFEEGDLLGEGNGFTLGVREERVICVLVNAEPEYFREVSGVPLGSVDTKVAVKFNGSESSAYSLHHTIYETEDIGFIVNEGSNKISLNKNGSKTISVEGYPFNLEEKNLYVESSDTDIVAVNNSGEITALKAGTADVIITDLTSGYQEVIKVSVAGSNDFEEEEEEDLEQDDTQQDDTQQDDTQQDEDENESEDSQDEEMQTDKDEIGTGDQTNAAKWMILCLASLSVIGLAVWKRKKYKE